MTFEGTNWVDMQMALDKIKPDGKTRVELLEKVLKHVEDNKMNPRPVSTGPLTTGRARAPSTSKLAGIKTEGESSRNPVSLDSPPDGKQRQPGTFGPR